MTLAQFDYIFAIGVIFAFLDAFNIGCHDVANSFSSSVSARSLKYWQAMVLACICEFLGAVLAGSRVSDTIKGKIVDVDTYKDTPAVLMMTMASGLIGSSIWLSFTTSIGMPVSSTHSIVGAVLGAGCGANGFNSVHWGWEGFSQIVASWFIAPLLSGSISAIIFLLCKYGILEKQNDLRNAFYFTPIIVFVAFASMTMLITWKGAPNLKLNDLSTGATVGSIMGVGAVAVVIYVCFLYPYYYQKLVRQDWRLRPWDALRGPALFLKRNEEVPPMPKNHELVIDYYKGRRFEENSPGFVESSDDVQTDDAPNDEEKNVEKANEENISEIESETIETTKKLSWNSYVSDDEYKQWKIMLRKPAKWPFLIYLVISHGWRQDIIGNQSLNQGHLGQGVTKIHQKSKCYDLKVEHIFALLQVFTACTMSFAHGANDVSNAAGPLSTIYTVWKFNLVEGKSDVPVWVLCFTAASLVLGAWTFGYILMSNLGNKMILQSPSRGFAIELGAAITVVMATRLGIPVSTTQCAVGGTVFVGLCNMDLKAINWRMVTWCYLGFILTVPSAAIMAGIINAVILHGPRMGEVYQLT